MQTFCFRHRTIWFRPKCNFGSNTNSTDKIHHRVCSLVRRLVGYEGRQGDNVELDNW